MLIVQKKPTWHANVDVTFAGDKTTHRFVAEFTPIPQSELEALSSEQATDREIARRILVGWNGVQDADGTELAFTEDNRETLIDLHPVAACLVRKYYDEISSAKRKN